MGSGYTRAPLLLVSGESSEVAWREERRHRIRLGGQRKVESMPNRES